MDKPLRIAGFEPNMSARTSSSLYLATLLQLAKHVLEISVVIVFDRVVAISRRCRAWTDLPADCSKSRVGAAKNRSSREDSAGNLATAAAPIEREQYPPL